MSIYVASAYALSATGTLEGWKPIIGWHDLVTTTSLTVTEEDELYPGTNLANPATNLLWKSGSTSDSYIKVLFASQSVDYFAFARHNFGSGLCLLTLQGLPPGGDHTDDGDWIELVPQQLLDGDGPALLRFALTTLIGLRLKLEPDAVEPQAAVVFCGKLLVLANGLPPGHTPITYGRNVRVSSPRSQGGDHLGRIVQTASLSSSIVQQNLDPTWYREKLEPFRAACDAATFFWAWAPEDHPSEVGYCEVVNDPKPVVSQTTGLIDISFELAGVAL